MEHAHTPVETTRDFARNLRRAAELLEETTSALVGSRALRGISEQPQDSGVRSAVGTCQGVVAVCAELADAVQLSLRDLARGVDAAAQSTVETDLAAAALLRDAATGGRGTVDSRWLAGVSS